MWSKTMSTLFVLVGASGAWTSIDAQSPTVVAEVTVGIGDRPAAGPCRSGRVRPVRGRTRCALLGRRVVASVWPHRYRTGSEWIAVRWGSARAPWDFRSGEAYVPPRQLRRVIGRHDHRRIRDHARAMGLRGPLSGSWAIYFRGPAVLEIRVEGVPVAAMIDHDRDGYTDVTLLRRHW